MNQEIQNLLQTYQRGLKEADVDLVRAVYAWDGIFIGQPFPTATRIDEIVALYATIFQSSTSAFSAMLGPATLSCADNITGWPLPKPKIDTFDADGYRNLVSAY